MNQFKILAYFMHEFEADLIKNNSTVSKQTDSFFISDVDQHQFELLKEHGIIFQVLEDNSQTVMERAIIPEAGVFEEMAAEEDFGVDGMGADLAIEEETEESMSPFPKFYKFSTVGPLLEEEKQDLEGIGIEIVELISPGIYVVRVKEKSELQKLKNINFTRNIEYYSSSDSNKYIKKEILGDQVNLNETKIATYDVLLHRKEDLPEFVEWLKGKNILIGGAEGFKTRLYLLEDSSFIDEISANQMVKYLCDYVPPKLHNDIASTIIGVDAYSANVPLAAMSFQGEGEIVGIADTGVDENHPDLKNQIIGTSAWGRKNDASDPAGHGTHVAGSVAGDGKASAGNIKGIAPKAKLFFQSLLNSNDGLTLPLQLQDLFEEAYGKGARIHNNSWGSSTGSRYTVNSIEVDDFVYSKKDMLLVFSAGNDGNALVYSNVPQGFVDFLTIGSPASAKNVLTVGASRSTRSIAGLSTMTYKDAWPKSFPYPPYYDKEKVSGNPECLAGFSSRGPCDDNRIKPDVVAPGTDIASTKSSLASLSSFWGTYPGNPDYAIMGGTSMSAPIVSGFAALVREYYVKTHNHVPSAALLKATIINGCKKLNGQDAVLNHGDLPNWNQGFGMIDSSKTIPSPMNNFFFYYYDNYNQLANQFVRTGQRMRLRFTVTTPGGWLKICLAYTDIPARALQNNINIMLDNQSTKWLGNEKAPKELKSLDTINNVEVIAIDTMAAGTYTLQVVASNLLKGPQDFAIVIASSDQSIVVTNA